MTEAFFAWVHVNEVPFFAVLLALIGALVVATLCFVTAVDLLILTFRKIKAIRAKIIGEPHEH